LRSRHVSSSPSKIPYGGFSPVRLQTGYQPWRPSPARRSAVRARHAITRPPLVSLSSFPTIAGSVARTPPVQRPLARQRVVVSRRVVAYYGRIRVSRTLAAGVCIHTTDLPPSVCSRAGPRGSPIYSACLSRRAVFLTPLDRKGALDRFFPSRLGLHQFRSVSASKIPRHPIRRGGLTRLQSSLHVTARSGLLRSSFRSLCRHRKRRVGLHGYRINSRGLDFHQPIELRLSCSVDCGRGRRVFYFRVRVAGCNGSRSFPPKLSDYSPSGFLDSFGVWRFAPGR
jgi:hypothetical protein